MNAFKTAKKKTIFKLKIVNSRHVLLLIVRMKREKINKISYHFQFCNFKIVSIFSLMHPFVAETK